jgi:hypothetical protein
MNADAQELSNDLANLDAQIGVWMAKQSDIKQMQYLNESRALIRLKKARLDALISGNSAMSQANVFLWVSSINKGLGDIGGNWRGDPEIAAAIIRITEKSYSLYMATRDK